MKRYIISLSCLLLIYGCSSKPKFTPPNVDSVSSTEKSLKGKIVYVTRNGATLNTGAFIGKGGKKDISLGEGYRYLDESTHYVIAGNDEGILKIIDKEDESTKRAVALHLPIISAAISENGLIAYVLQGNTFGVYRVQDNRKLLESKSQKSLAIDTRHAAPLFVGSLVVIPTFDGKLIVADPHNIENAKALQVSANPHFNNIIYLKRIGDYLVAATASKVVVISPHGKYELEANIGDVTIGNGALYIATKDGKIIKTNPMLQALTDRSFKYARFITIGAFDEKVYAVEAQGILFVLDNDLKKVHYYSIDTPEATPVIVGKRLYINHKVIDLSKL